MNVSRNSLKWVYIPHGGAICVICELFGPIYEEAEAMTKDFDLKTYYS